MSENHVCDRCGKLLNPVNWWIASVGDRYGKDKWKLCVDCATVVEEAMRKIVAGFPRL